MDTNGLIRRAIKENAREFTEVLLKVWRDECKLEFGSIRTCGKCFLKYICDRPMDATDRSITTVAATLAERALKAWLPPEGKGGG